MRTTCVFVIRQRWINGENKYTDSLQPQPSYKKVFTLPLRRSHLVFSLGQAMKQFFLRLNVAALFLLTPTLVLAQRPSFTLAHDHVDTFDYAEITVRMPPVKSIEDVLITGLFIGPTNDTTRIDGFCDSPDGSLHRIRFMPVKTGSYQFTIKSYAIYRRQIKNVLTTGMAQTGSYFGMFTATADKRKGQIQPDAQHRYSVRPASF
jgi:hypothetical protein